MRLRPRPVGTCDLCGKLIWSRREVRYPAGRPVHVDCTHLSYVRKRRPPLDATGAPWPN